MASLIDAINVKRRTVFEHENAPFYCLEAEISTPTARGGQTLVRLKVRNLLTGAVLDKTFKAGEKFKEPDMQLVPVSYLYSDGDGSYFLDQDNFLGQLRIVVHLPDIDPVPLAGLQHLHTAVLRVPFAHGLVQNPVEMGVSVERIRTDDQARDFPFAEFHPR